jgi:protein-S-isoprenylcysteine O-methyltransferase Ste14
VGAAAWCKIKVRLPNEEKLQNPPQGVDPMTSLNFRALRSSVIGALGMAVILFGLAGTLSYWQGWVFWAVFVGTTSAITIDLAIRDPELLERRMRAGPRFETEPQQKLAVGLVFLGFFALLLIPLIAHRFGWLPVPAWVSLLGDALVLLGFLLVYLVIRQNRFAASTIQVEEGQQVVSTGLYGAVRHPMYAGALPLLVGIPLALGSWLGLVGVPVIVAAFIWRLLDEERFLHQKLPGYTEYTRRVRWRLLPGVF